MSEAAQVIDALARRDAGQVLLDAASPGVHLVGGAVRDLLLGREPRELDVAVQFDVLPLARELVQRLGGGIVSHERFGTATVETPLGRVDLAQTRSEIYGAPGELPEVRLGASLEEDLARRDFTVNALAVSLAGPDRGALRGAPGARRDLDAGVVRVMHDASFREDPTRMLRLARYSARLGLTIESHTLTLLGAAIAEGALGTISGARLGAEVRLALGQGALDRLAELGLLEALNPALLARGELAKQALELLGASGRSDLLVLSAGALEFEVSALSRWLDSLAFGARDRDVVLDAVEHAPRLAERLSQTTVPSQIYALAHRRPAETVALAGALGAQPAARRWLGELRRVTLEITGDDLLAAGVTPGPEVGRRLARALSRRLDGEIEPGREAELHTALDG